MKLLATVSGPYTYTMYEYLTQYDDVELLDSGFKIPCVRGLQGSTILHISPSHTETQNHEASMRSMTNTMRWNKGATSKESEQPVIVMRFNITRRKQQVGRVVPCQAFCYTFDWFVSLGFFYQA